VFVFEKTAFVAKLEDAERTLKQLWIEVFVIDKKIQKIFAFYLV
jgi:hypothetical protein